MVSIPRVPTIDPRLPPIPVTGVKYVESDADTSDDVPVLLEVVSTDGAIIDFAVGEGSEGSSDSQLDPPSSITVISQTVKVGTAGTQTVDLVVEIGDVAGAAEYERRDAV